VANYGDDGLEDARYASWLIWWPLARMASAISAGPCRSASVSGRTCRARGPARGAHCGDPRIRRKSVPVEFDPIGREFSDCVGAGLAHPNSPGHKVLRIDFCKGRAGQNGDANAKRTRRCRKAVWSGQANGRTRLPPKSPCIPMGSSARACPAIPRRTGADRRRFPRPRRAALPPRSRPRA
jgi:hypothetical protein